MLNGVYVVEDSSIQVIVGCCGFPVSRRKYYSVYRLVELQNTFYNLPSIDWAERLADEKPEGFIITMKAWQVITHPSKSPTWRKLRTRPSGILENYGFLKPTSENYRAWDKTLEVAGALKARAIVLQTPSSLPFDNESIKWVREFFKNIASVTPRDIVVGWEPRGAWAAEEARDVLRSILGEYRITHIVDPFRRKPVYIHGILYYRLHGIGKGETNYRYKYSDGDLLKLADMILETGFRTVYVLFNNVYMFQDGQRFREIALNKGLKTI